MAQAQSDPMMQAIQAIHKQSVNAVTAPPGQGAQGPPGASQMPPDAEDQQDQGQDEGAEQQAVWDEFPSTDPQNAQALAQQMQGQDPEAMLQALQQWMAQADSDRQKLDQMQEAMLNHFMDLLGGPSGAPQAGPQAASPQAPGVGGEGTGY